MKLREATTGLIFLAVLATVTEGGCWKGTALPFDGMEECRTTEQWFYKTSRPTESCPPVSVVEYNRILWWFAEMAKSGKCIKYSEGGP